MTLVERLRDAAALPTGLYAEAADRIEELEKVCAMALEALGELHYVTSQNEDDYHQTNLYGVAAETITALRKAIGETK